jgi:hypothetical protein
MTPAVRRAFSLSLLLALAGCGPTSEDPGLDDLGSVEAAAVAPKQVLYVGDSIAWETSPVVRYFLTSANKAVVTVAAKPGLAICDYFPGTPSLREWGDPHPPDLYAAVRASKPQAVAMQFWGNSWDLTPCMKDAAGVILQPGTQAYYARYASDAAKAMQFIRDAATSVNIPMPKVLWVMQGPDHANAARPRILNEAYAALRSSWSTVTTVDAGREVSLAANYFSPGDRYGWTQFLPCSSFEVSVQKCPASGFVQLHKDGDDIHFCLGTVDTAANCSIWSPGLVRYGLKIVDAVNVSLGL